MNEALPMLKDFILPAGTLVCSFAHQARSVYRRAERSVMLSAINVIKYPSHIITTFEQVI